jgi:hypothetical protein
LNISDIKLICGAQRLPCGDRIVKKNIAHWLAAHPKKKRGHPKLKKVVATATTDDANNTHTHPKTGVGFSVMRLWIDRKARTSWTLVLFLRMIYLEAKKLEDP